jgi:hypothetical protein
MPNILKDHDTSNYQLSLILDHYVPRKQLDVVKSILEHLFHCKTYDDYEISSILHSLNYTLLNYKDDPICQQMIQFIKDNVSNTFPRDKIITLTIRKILIDVCSVGDFDNFKFFFDIYPVYDSLNGYGYLLPYAGMSGNVELFKHIYELHPISFGRMTFQFENSDFDMNDMRVPNFIFRNTKYLDGFNQMTQKCDTWNLAYLFACFTNNHDIIKYMLSQKDIPISQLTDGIIITEKCKFYELKNYIEMSCGFRKIDFFNDGFHIPFEYG